MAILRLITNDGVKITVVCHGAPPALARAGGGVPVGKTCVQVTCVVQAAPAGPLQASCPFQRSLFSPGFTPPCFSPPKSMKVWESRATSVAPVRNPIAPVVVTQLASIQEMDLFATALVLPNG